MCGITGWVDYAQDLTQQDSAGNVDGPTVIYIMA
jgi:hypothetical protein